MTECIIELFHQMRDLEELYCDVEIGDVDCMDLVFVDEQLQAVYDKWKSYFPVKSKYSAVIAVEALSHYKY